MKRVKGHIDEILQTFHAVLDAYSGAFGILKRALLVNLILKGS